jgi:3-mercaptopyruvate sulfurtransferase SseA
MILAAATALATAANAVRPRRIAWFVPHDVIYPPPAPRQAAAAIARQDVMDALERGTAIVDARKPESFQAGHIPGAINIPADDPLPHLESLTMRCLPEDLVIVYCGGQQCDDSRIVFDLLTDSGFPNVRIYFGGWKEWTEAGLDVEK